MFKVGEDEYYIEGANILLPVTAYYETLLIVEFHSCDFGTNLNIFYRELPGK